MSGVHEFRSPEQVQTLVLPCDCSLVASHRRGDVRITCGHGTEWVIRAVVQPVQYLVERPKGSEE